ncbi:hypothetical protein JB92DRAFT_2986301 [Gautieria morchelliformis]|nr:hypothetical protein JB92DRAFT_2986301 [Gautieria morchelliformis]
MSSLSLLPHAIPSRSSPSPSPLTQRSEGEDSGAELKRAKHISAHSAMSSERSSRAASSVGQRRSRSLPPLPIVPTLHPAIPSPVIAPSRPEIAALCLSAITLHLLIPAALRLKTAALHLKTAAFRLFIAAVLLGIAGIAAVLLDIAAVRLVIAAHLLITPALLLLTAAVRLVDNTITKKYLM